MDLREAELRAAAEWLAEGSKTKSDLLNVVNAKS
jgi:hypothetical protein